jgi:hypothetical protein
MAKLTGPLLSFGAKGQLGKTMVMSKWRGIPYARQHVVPTNPNTTAQQVVRKTFALLREMWKVAPAPVLDTWNSFAQGRPFLGVNKFVGENVRVLNGEALMTNMILSPGSKGGPGPISMEAEAGAAEGEIDVTFVIPAAPNGWALFAIVAAAFNDQAPDGFFVGPFVAEQVAAPATTLTLEGLGDAESCIVGGWLIWTKPDGSKAYSVSTTVTAVSGAGA